MSPSDDDLFRWQALFQRSREPVFLLNRRRRILFVNRAWEELAGLPLAQARGLRCRRFKSAEQGSPEAIGHALAPPAEALEGKPARTRRPFVTAAGQRAWWDAEYFPLLDADGLLGILGKVSVVAEPTPAPAVPLPEKLIALREEMTSRYRLDQLATDDPASQRVLEQARLASQTLATVLIVGPLGAGKQWLARAIHYQGITRERGFAAVDCAALPQPAVADILFGSGSLTRPHRLGTLYLREPASLPRELQARLVDWLTGTTKDKPRLIAGCRSDPAADVHSRRMLAELHCALAILQVVLPPLRDRREELPQLVDSQLNRGSAFGSKAIAGLTAAAQEMIKNYSWPGNLRELHAVLTSARLHAGGERIDAPDLPAYVRQAVELDRIAGRPEPRSLSLDTLLEQVERRLIVLSLRAAQGNRSEAARTLGISRARLLRRLEMLGIADK